MQISQRIEKKRKDQRNKSMFYDIISYSLKHVQECTRRIHTLACELCFNRAKFCSLSGEWKKGRKSKIERKEKKRRKRKEKKKRKETKKRKKNKKGRTKREVFMRSSC